MRKATNEHLMKKTLTTLFVILTLKLFGQITPFENLRPIITDLNNDKVSDTIFLSSFLMDNSSFRKITISIRGFDRQLFVAKNAWTNVDSSFLAKNKNAIKSNEIFLRKEKDHSVILLFGYLDAAGYREEFSIIQVRENKAKMVFEGDEKNDN